MREPHTAYPLPSLQTDMAAAILALSPTSHLISQIQSMPLFHLRIAETTRHSHWSHAMPTGRKLQQVNQSNQANGSNNVNQSNQANGSGNSPPTVAYTCEDSATGPVYQSSGNGNSQYVSGNTVSQSSGNGGAAQSITDGSVSQSTGAFSSGLICHSRAREGGLHARMQKHSGG